MLHRCCNPYLNLILALWQLHPMWRHTHVDLQFAATFNVLFFLENVGVFIPMSIRENVQQQFLNVPF